MIWILHHRGQAVWAAVGLFKHGILGFQDCSGHIHVCHHFLCQIILRIAGALRCSDLPKESYLEVCDISGFRISSKWEQVTEGITSNLVTWGQVNAILLKRKNCVASYASCTCRDMCTLSLVTIVHLHAVADSMFSNCITWFSATFCLPYYILHLCP